MNSQNNSPMAVGPEERCLVVCTQLRQMLTSFGVPLDPEPFRISSMDIGWSIDVFTVDQGEYGNAIDKALGLIASCGEFPDGWSTCLSWGPKYVRGCWKLGQQPPYTWRICLFWL